MARTQRRRPRRRPEKWQTLLAAAIAAVAAVVVALIQAGDGGDGKEDDETPSSTGIAISSIVLLSANPPPVVRILGTATGLSALDLIYVVARPPEEREPGSSGPEGADPASGGSGENGTRWIASDPARRSADGTWEVDFRLPPDAQLPLSFVAVIYPLTRPVDPGGPQPGPPSTGETAAPTSGPLVTTGRSTPPPTGGTGSPSATSTGESGEPSDGAGQPTSGIGAIPERLETTGPAGLSNSGEFVGP